MISTVYSLVQNLSSEPSTNARIEMLQAAKEDTDVLAFFTACLGSLKYGVKKIPAYVPAKQSSVQMKDLLDLLDDLAYRRLTGNAAKDAVKKMLEACDAKGADLLERMLAKFPNCGVSRSLCRAVWPESFANEIKLLKAMPFSAKNLDSIHWPAESQIKMDGARCLAFVENGEVVFCSSSGKEFQKLEPLAKDISEHFPDGCVVDGELLVVDESFKRLSRKEGNGILNKSLHGTISEKEAGQVRFFVWDLIPMKDYEAGRGTVPYAKTLQDLEMCCADTKRVRFIHSKTVNSREEAFIHFQQMLNRGEEGTILKNREMVWEGKRSKSCVKFKIIIENTLKAVDVIEGTGKFKGMAGAVTVETSDGLVRVNVGSGFSDEERHALWDAKEDLLEKGLFLEVKSNGLIRAEDDTWSLFLPRCSEIRLDKTEADDFATVEALSTGAEMLGRVEKA